MMSELPPLPQLVTDFADWQWQDIEPYYRELLAFELTTVSVDDWLARWSNLSDLVDESYWRYYVAVSRNTSDANTEKRNSEFLDRIFVPAQRLDQKLKIKLLSSELEPAGFQVPLRNMRAEVSLYREANLELLSEEEKLTKEYDQIIGAQTVTWNGTEVTLSQLAPILQDPDRNVRERAWRLMAARQLADREALDSLWKRLLRLRRQIAANAGVDDYRTYRWRQLLRFDYTPDDCKRFHDAIEQVVVPVAARLYEKRKNELGLRELRPWDIKGPQGLASTVDSSDNPPLLPFASQDELQAKCSAIFHRIDPELGSYFDLMRREKLLDLDSRKNKAPSSYCTSFQLAKRPFLFMNAVGIPEDVYILSHEAGHAFHILERTRLPYFQQRAESYSPREFDEVASISMEFLATRYLDANEGGFYSNADATRARSEKLYQAIFWWPYIAVVDAFQHWAYENIEAAMVPTECDAQWKSLWDRFMVGVSWEGLELEAKTSWRRQLHIFTVPFYYIEYGLGQLGAVQVWENALRNPTKAVASYRYALGLGATATVPSLYAAAGAKFAFDHETIRSAVSLLIEGLTFRP